MILIWETQQSARNAALLQHIEQTETLGDGKSIVFGAVNNEMRSLELQDVLGGRGVPAAVVVTIGPEGAIELKRNQQPHSTLKEGRDKHHVR